MAVTTKRSRTQRDGIRIVSIDLQPMTPLEGVTTIRADITHPNTPGLIYEALTSNNIETSKNGEVMPDPNSHLVDLVVCDGAPDVTGLHDLDIYVQSQLLWAALNITLQILRPGGNFVAKIFRAQDADVLLAQMRTVFERVTISKPRSSRSSSLEAFVVCQGLREDPIRSQARLQADKFDTCTRHFEPSIPNRGPSAGIVGSAVHPYVIEPVHNTQPQSTESGLRATEFRTTADWITPFLTSGDLSAFDSDASHRLSVSGIPSA